MKSATENRIYSYEPVIDEGCRLLILGTMPSVKSLEEGFYYAHPRNAFWPIMAHVLGEEAPGSVEEKKKMLLRHGVALWDTARSCVREGSLDADMREVELSDLPGLFARYPGIRRVLLNGGAAWALYHRQSVELVRSRPCFRLPSTSPAYTLPFEKKLEAWREAICDMEAIP